MDVTEESSFWVFLRLLPKRSAPLHDQLTEICSSFGKVLKVVIMHGRGQALVQMSAAKEAAKIVMHGEINGGIMHSEWKKAAMVKLGAERGTKKEGALQAKGWDMNNEKVVTQEVYRRSHSPPVQY